MNALDRKLLRDLVHLRSQILAVAAVVACGVATFVTMVSVYQSLLATRTTYYERYRFADIFTHLRRAPESLLRSVAALPGVARAESRIVMDVTLDVPGLAEPATGRLISLPPHRVAILNDLHLRGGRWIEPGHDDEVIASEAFSSANHLATGDTIGAVINGRWRRLRIVGIALSPEYVYEMNGAAMVPDNRRFGVLWVGRPALGAAFDMTDAFNDVTLRLASGAVEKDVIDQLDHLLAPYAGIGAYGRGDQMSHRFLSDELTQLEANATIIPVIFLGVAAFLLHIVLSRLVGTQRDQVAVLKAFGYANRTIGLHYMQFALAAVMIGAVLGTFVGMWLGLGLTKLYTQFYRFPILRYEAGAGVIAWAVVIAGGSAVLGALAAVRRAVKLPPAEAMRPEAPASFRPGLSQWRGLAWMLSTSARMVLRNVERSPVKALLSVLGIALSVSILIVGYFSYDSINEMVDLEFRTAERADVTVSFIVERPVSTLLDLRHLPGVLRAEGFRAVAARLRNQHFVRTLGVQGIEPHSTLRRIVDQDHVAHVVPEGGLLITSKLAELLHLRVGDSVTVEFLEGRRPVRRVPVAGLVDEVLGLSAYMNLDALNRTLEEPPVISGAWLAVDTRMESVLYEQLKHTPAIAGAAVRRSVLESFEKTIGENQGIARFALVIFASVIAIGIVYNSARIALSERGREMASLRVLGFTRGEVALTLLGEQALITLVAIPAGFGLGYLFAAGTAAATSSDLYRLPVVISSATYASAAIVVLGASFLSSLLVRRRLDRLDIVDVLKTRE